MFDSKKEIQEMLEYAMDEWDENLLTYDNLKDIVKYVYEKWMERWFNFWK